MTLDEALLAFLQESDTEDYSLKTLDLMTCDPDKFIGRGSRAEWEELIPDIISRAVSMSDEEIDSKFNERERLLYLEYCSRVLYESYADATEEDYE